MRTLHQRHTQRGYMGKLRPSQQPAKLSEAAVLLRSQRSWGSFHSNRHDSKPELRICSDGPQKRAMFIWHSGAKYGGPQDRRWGTHLPSAEAPHTIPARETGKIRGGLQLRPLEDTAHDQGAERSTGCGQGRPRPDSSRGAAPSERTVREPRAGLAERLEGRRERRSPPLLPLVRRPSGGKLQAQVGALASPYTKMLN